MITGTIDADAISVAQFEVDFRSCPNTSKVLAGIINTRTKATIAWLERGHGSWSKRTLKLMEDLRQSMEEDLAPELLVEGVSTNSATQLNRTGVEPGGLGERLQAQEEAESI